MHFTLAQRFSRLLLSGLIVTLAFLALLFIQSQFGPTAAVQPALAYAPAVTITPSNRTLTVAPASSQILTHTVTNSGDQAGEFVVTVASDQNLYNVSIIGRTNPFTTTINAGGTLDVNVQVTVSGAAGTGTTGAVTLLTTLASDANINATGVNVLTVAAPTATPTLTPTPTPDAAIYTDSAEPNNTIPEAFEIIPGTERRCQLTLWPVGDVDIYRFYARQGAVYEITTESLSAGLDTFMTVRNANFDVIGSNDNYQDTGGASQFYVTAATDGFYFAEITNVSGSDPANKTYCIQVTQVVPTATPTPELLQPDNFEDNGNFDIATLLEANLTISADFVPPIPPGPDNDFYRLWVKPGLLVTCETTELSGVNDTNMIIYDANRNGLAGNDDKEPGDLGSRVSVLTTYTGWLYVLVGPVNVPTYDDSPLFTYKLTCETTASTPTPTPTPTVTPGAPSGGGFPAPPTATPTLIPSPTPVDDGLPTPFPATPTPTPRPNVSFQPLPTPTPAGGGGLNMVLDVTVYYDQNLNFMPEQNEGIMNVQVSLYDSATGAWLAFGYTNEAGAVPFGPLEVNGPVLVSVPYLGFNETVSADTTALAIRVAPQTLPSGIP